MRRLFLGCLGLVLVGSLTLFAQRAARSRTLTYEQINIGACCAAATLSTATYSAPSGESITLCEMEVESFSVRYRLDGGTATTTAGMSLIPGDDPVVFTAGDASRLSLMGYASSGTAVVNVSCGR